MITFSDLCKDCGEFFEQDSNEQDSCYKCIRKNERANEPEKLKQLRNVLENKVNTIVIGAGGSGKSFYVNKISEQLREENICFEILCPTGNSAINVRGLTYHSLFMWSKLRGMIESFFFVSLSFICNLANSDDDIKEKMSKKANSLYKRIKALDVIIFDEFGMISKIHFTAMDRLCRIINNNNKPFGGIQLIVFGDPFQFRPVKGDYCFLSSSWDECGFQMIELNGDKLPRFTTQLFSDITRICRIGIISKKVIDMMKTREIEPESKITELYYSNNEVDKSNQKEYGQLDGQEFIYPSNLNTLYCISKINNKKFKIEVFNGSCLYDSSNDALPVESQDLKRIRIDNLYNQIKQSYSKTIDNYTVKDVEDYKKGLKAVYGDNYMNIALKIGARVICTVNTKEDGSILYANGTTGKVIKCESEYVVIEDDFGKQIKVNYKTIDQRRKIKLDTDTFIDVIISFRHIPLRLGYSITLHRSQGMTLENKVLITGCKKIAGMAYVAISRVRKLEDIYYKNFKFDKLQVSSNAIIKFKEHYDNEIKYLSKEHPDWFDDFYIQTDNDSVIQHMCRSIVTTLPINPLTNEIKMPEISGDTKRERIIMDRGDSQTKLRAWLLENQKQCLFTGEIIPELLEAAHIRNYSTLDAINSHAGNALLMRRDFHSLYDSGYFSLENDGVILQSKTFASHPFYSAFKKIDIPSFVNKEYLDWHRSNIYNKDK
jgi:hypothetical protein